MVSLVDKNDDWKITGTIYLGFAIAIGTAFGIIALLETSGF